MGDETDHVEWQSKNISGFLRDRGDQSRVKAQASRVDLLEFAATS
jgi:hypothetical protein